MHRRRALTSTETDALLQRVHAALSVSNPRGLASDYRTMLVIAHRLSTVQHADQILVLEKGQIRFSGTMAQLADDEDTRRAYLSV